MLRQNMKLIGLPMLYNFFCTFLNPLLRKLIFYVKQLAFLAFLNTALTSVVGATPLILDSEYRRSLILGQFGDQIVNFFYKDGQGRLDLSHNKEKSYAIITKNPEDLTSPTLLLPLASIRFDKYNFSTDEWWRQNQETINLARKNGQTPPQQNPEEVERWLIEHNLSVDPLVYRIYPLTKKVETLRLQKFLLAEVYEKLAKDNYIDLYRGDERSGELDTWLSGQVPKGARYWTPDLQYALRYARKSESFLPDLLNDKGPLLHFRMDMGTFRQAVTAGNIILGAEWPKRLHQRLENGDGLTDHLYNGMLYLGHPDLGVDLEMRVKSSWSRHLQPFFVGSVKALDLIENRKNVLLASYQRAYAQWPAQKAKFTNELEVRLKVLGVEHDLLTYGVSGTSKSPLLWEATNNDFTDLYHYLKNHTESRHRKCKLGLTP